MRLAILLVSATLAFGTALLAATPPKKEAPEAPASNSVPSALDGEKRFRANCGRCHQPPHKFPPRMMATIVRHMRVRATLTDEDVRLILAYMTE